MKSPFGAPWFWKLVNGVLTTDRSVAIGTTDSTKTTIDPDTGITTPQITIGSPLSSEAIETPITERSIENDAGERMVGYAETLELTDETSGTEDTVKRIYVMVGGVLKLWRSTKIYTAAPSGSEAPAPGCIVLADRATWDPLAKGSGGAYYAMYRGSSSGWGALTDQLD